MKVPHWDRPGHRIRSVRGSTGLRAARRLFRARVRSEEGGVLVLVALSASAAIAFSALAIDIGMLMTARDEAQRAADAGALAAASAYLETPRDDALQPAKDRARRLLGANTLRNVPIDTTLLSSTTDVDTLEEAIVELIPDRYQARVTVRRKAIPLWFARIMGINDWGVSASAVAEATDAGAADCVKPFAIPDAWSDADDDTNLNRIWDGGEEWDFGSSPGDYYQSMTTANDGATATGYGSDFRKDYDHDFGRPIYLKVTNPNDSQLLTTSVFLPWRLDPDPTMGQCTIPASGKQDPGASTYRRNICQCNKNPVEIGRPYQIETGDMVGPTYQGVKELIGQDPDAVWDQENMRIDNSLWGDDWRHSPRVIRVGVFDPSLITGSGMETITFNNIALFFLQEQASPAKPVVGHFMFFAEGTPTAGPNAGSLVKRLRLVQ